MSGNMFLSWPESRKSLSRATPYQTSIPQTGAPNSACASPAPRTRSGIGLGKSWVAWTDRYRPVWELLRKEYLERPFSLGHAPKALASLLKERATLGRSASGLRDPRLTRLAVHHAVAGGHDPRNVPWWMGFLDHVEQVFGTWTAPGGPR